MAIHLVSFIGLAPSSEQHLTPFGEWHDIQQRQAILHRSALEYGDVDYCHAWDRLRLLETEYYSNNKDLLDRPRGCGYWAWKPYIILQTMQQAAEGDAIIYCDVGKPSAAVSFDHGNVIETSLKPLVQWAEHNNGMLPGVYLANHGPAKAWVKRDCFQLMNCDTEPYHSMPTVQAGYTVWTNTASVRTFLQQWQQLNTDSRLISDDPNTLGLENYPEFQRHAHDQATLSLLCEQQKAMVFGHKKHQFWGFRNINYIAKEAAFVLASNNGSLALKRVNQVHNLISSHLVRWLELVLIDKHQQALRVALLDEQASLSESQLIAWQHYLPNAKIEVLQAQSGDYGWQVYDCFIQISSKEPVTDSALMVNVYKALADNGAAFIGPLEDSSEYEEVGRYVSKQGVFPDQAMFQTVRDDECSPKIPNSRNPIFLPSHKNGLYSLMIRPKSLKLTQVANAQKETGVLS